MNRVFVSEEDSSARGKNGKHGKPAILVEKKRIGVRFEGVKIERVSPGKET